MQNLNPEQQQVVNHIQGALLVLAPAGTGKTSILTKRVVNAIRQGVPAERILCVTFTNRAAKEMRDRLQNVCSDVYHKLTIKTFHGLCVQLLRFEAKQIGLPTDFRIFDDADSWELLKIISGLSDQNKVERKKLNEISKALQESKTHCKKHSLSLEFSSCIIFDSLASQDKAIAMQYQKILQQQHALDFTDLVFYTRAMLNCQLDIGKRWGDRYEFIQVDEVQDTHLSEYEVIYHFARLSGNIALIGDLDQAIYEWRGSQPLRLIESFTNDFNPKRHDLKYNYRATKNLLNAASGFADSFAIRHTNCTPHSKAVEGELIYIHIADDENAEGEWIANKLKSLAQKDPNFSYNRVSVLTRTNYRSNCISKQLIKANVPCITVEQFEFFQRQEIKDVLAYINFLISPFDSHSFRRIIKTPSKGIGDRTIDKIMISGEIGLKLTDFSSSRTLSGEPFNDLLNAYANGEIVVFDTETTGLSSATDEVIELGAIKLRQGKQIAKFHYYLKNTIPVGDSERIHKISDAYLSKYGQPASKVFQDFVDFIGNALLVGHNVCFDIKMLTAHTQRIGIVCGINFWVDTWDISTRFIKSENYKLETLAHLLNLPIRKAHSAIEDALTTWDLLHKLIPLIKEKTTERTNIVYEYSGQFNKIATQIEQWREQMLQQRPADLLQIVIKESQIDNHYVKEDNRIQNLIKLWSFFKERDDPALDPETALRAILEYIALTKNVDLISKTDNLVPIITIHQSKGLEFDTVFLAGAVDSELPSYFSLQSNGNLEEEKRMFYVALTRAKHQLFITGHAEDSRGFNKTQSSFISHIPQECYQYLI